MNNIIHIIRHTARAATVLLLALLTAQTAGAQDLTVLKVFDEVPTVTSGQSSNWNEDMEICWVGMRVHGFLLTTA